MRTLRPKYDDSRPNIALGEFFDLSHDPRSTTAMLQGSDDGRSQLFERFAALMNARAHHLDMAAIAIKYTGFEMTAYVQTRHLPYAWRQVATRLLIRTKIHLGWIQEI